MRRPLLVLGLGLTLIGGALAAEILDLNPPKVGDREGWNAELDRAREDGDSVRTGRALYQLGFIYENEGETERAIAALEESVSLLPPMDNFFFASYQRLAQLYEDGQRYDDAERAWREMAAAFPGNSDLARDGRGSMMLQLASFYHRTGRLDGAERTYLEGIEVLEALPFPNIALERGFGGLAELYTAQGRNARVRQTCERAQRKGVEVDRLKACSAMDG